MTQPLADDPLIGSTVGGHYKILERLGRGGVGAVYKARHELLDKLVAIKFLLQEGATDEAHVIRFQREAKVLSVLDHPNITRISEFGIDDRGHPYLVMDLLEGQTLSALIAARGRLVREVAVKIFSQICDALQHAHEKGIVHRDLKPSNVMLLGDGDELKVKILDFGLARLTGEGEAQKSDLTRTGDIFGSPPYMSPEQCLGEKVDARADIYSLGCLMYEALSGRRPFSADTTMGIVYQQIHDPPASFAAISPELKKEADLEAVVLNCMAKRPADRYQSVLLAKHALLNARGGLIASLALARGKFLATRPKLVWIVPGFISIFLLISVAVLFALPRSNEIWTWLNYRGQRAFDSGEYDKARQLFESAQFLSNFSSGDEKVYRERLTVGELSDLAAARNEKEESARLTREWRNISKRLSEEQNSLVNDLRKRLLTEFRFLKSKQTVSAEHKLSIDALCTLCLDTYVRGNGGGLGALYWEMLHETEQVIELNDGRECSLMGRCLLDGGECLTGLSLGEGPAAGNMNVQEGAHECFEQALKIYMRKQPDMSDIVRADGLLKLALNLHSAAVVHPAETAHYARFLQEARTAADEAKRIFLLDTTTYDLNVARAESVRARIMITSNPAEAAIPLKQAESIYRHATNIPLEDRVSFQTAFAGYEATARHDFKAATDRLEILLHLLEQEAKPGRSEAMICGDLRKLCNLYEEQGNFGTVLEHRLARLIPMIERLMPYSGAARYAAYRAAYKLHKEKAQKATDAIVYKKEKEEEKTALLTMQALAGKEKRISNIPLYMEEWVNLADCLAAAGELPAMVDAYAQAYAARPERNSTFAQYACPLMLVSAKDLARVHMSAQAQQLLDKSREVARNDSLLTGNARDLLSKQIDWVARQNGLE